LATTTKDLGPTITGPKANLNLVLKYFLNGALVSAIVPRQWLAGIMSTWQWLPNSPTSAVATSTL
jgi:hypothetical protein